METIADIVAEMRAKTAKSKDEAWYDKKKWAELCNRIEAAAKRIGEVRYQIQEPYKGEWTNLYSTQRSKRIAKFSAESSSKAAKNLGQNSQRRIVKVIQTEEVVWKSE